MRHDLLLACRDTQHLHGGEVLAVAALAMGVLAALLLEGDDLLALAVVHDLALDAGAPDQRSAELGLVAAQHQHFEVELGADIASEAFDLQDRVLGHFVLFSAGADDRIHGPKSLKVNGLRGTRVPRRAAEYTQRRFSVKYRFGRRFWTASGAARRPSLSPPPRAGSARHRPPSIWRWKRQRRCGRD